MLYLDFPLIEVKEFEQKDHLSQIYAAGLEYSILNKKNEMLLPYIFCKDWASDLVWAILNKKKAQIYGITCDYVGKEENLLGLRILVRNSAIENNDFFAQIQNSINLINDYFKLVFKIKKPAKIEINNYLMTKKGDKETLTLVLNLPFVFLSSPPLLSLLLLLIRCGVKYTENPLEYLKDISTPLDKTKYPPQYKIQGIQQNDSSYIEKALPLLEEMVKIKFSNIFKRKLNENWPEKSNTSQIHNSSGIVGFSNYYKKYKKSSLEFAKANFLI